VPESENGGGRPSLLWSKSVFTHLWHARRITQKKVGSSRCLEIGFNFQTGVGRFGKLEKCNHLKKMKYAAKKNT
jgi:hypothetical protein